MNNPKVAVAVFVENAGWGGDAAASVAALVAERYLKRKTEAHRLDAKIKASRFFPPSDGVLIPKKPAAPKKDTTQKSETPKPLMTETRPKSATLVAISGQ